MVVLEARDVTFCRSGSVALRRFSLAVLSGELLAVCGPPGAGTSSLLSVLGGAIRPDAGTVVRRAGHPMLCHGTDAAMAALAAAHERSVLLLDHPAAPDADEAEVLFACRAAAAKGAAVVVSTHDLSLAARFAHTAALLVAGRLVAWADPAIAFVPAVRILGYAGALSEAPAALERRRPHLVVAPS